MTLHEHRGRLDALMQPMVSWCVRHGVRPNTITVVSLILTAGASAAFLFSSPDRLWLLVVAPGVLSAGAMLDSLDGLVARQSETESALGDYLDHAFDRFADVAVLLGLTFSVWVPIEIGLFAIVGTLLTSYMGTQAQAVGVGRDYGGLLGRADRMMVLVAAPLIEVLLQFTGALVPRDLNLLYVATAWIAVAGNITALQRFWAALQELRSNDPGA